VDLSLLSTAIYGFSLSDMVSLWRPLIIFVLGITLYSIFIFKFYRFLARRKIFELKIHEYDIHIGLKKFLHVVECMVLFPFVIFFWFLVMSLLLTIISTSQSIETILFISVAFVSVVRIVAYYSEDLAKDLGKLIPFALLALFLIDGAYMSADSSLLMIQQLPAVWRILVYYLFFVIALETFLRLLTMRSCKHKEKDHDEFWKMVNA